MKQELVKKILNDTEKGYDLIAKKFSQTRNRFWKELEFIGRFSQKNDKILDFGCGNGRLLKILKGKNIDYVGVDVSENLINSAKNNFGNSNDFGGVNFLKIDNNFKHLPFQNDSFDSIYSIAVFHHIPDDAKRLEIVKELYRLSKRDGYIVITVWNLWNFKYRKNIFKNWENKILGRSRLDWNDCRITFTDNEGRIFERYHHAFIKGELKRLFKKSGFRVLNCKIIKGNIVLVGKK